MQNPSYLTKTLKKDQMATPQKTALASHLKRKRKRNSCEKWG